MPTLRTTPRFLLALLLLCLSQAWPVAAQSDESCDPASLDAPCPLADGSHVGGTLEQPGARNYFWFGAPEPGMHVRIDLLDLPADYDLYLFSDQSADPAQPYAQSVSPGLSPERIELDLAAPGTYLVEVVSDPGQAVAPDRPYTLLLSLSPPPAPTPEPTTPAPPPAAPAEPLRVAVPPLLYQAAPSAVERLRRLGLVADLETADRYAPSGPGTIADQEPAAGQQVEVGSHVRLLVASGDVAIPTLAGRPEQDATQQLRTAGFAVDTRHVRSADVPAGLVVEVRPGPGASLPAGSTVVLLVSQGS